MIAVALAVVTCLSVLPSYSVLADDGTDQTVSETKNSDSLLGPGDLGEALENAGAATLALDGGVDLLKKQPDLDLQDLKNYDNVKNAVAQLPSDQTIVKKHATDWQETIKPEVMQTLQNIVGYNTKFQQYYPILDGAAKSNNKETLKQGATLLKSDIDQKKAAVDRVIEQLQNYSDSLKDTDKLQLDTQTINSKLDTMESDGNKDSSGEKALGGSLIGVGVVTMVVGGVFAVKKGVFTCLTLPEKQKINMENLGNITITFLLLALGAVAAIVGGVFLYGGIHDSNNSKMNSAAQETERVKNQAAILNVTNTNVQSMRDNVKKTITALKDLSKGWANLKDQYQAAIDNLNHTPGDLGDSMTSQLDKAKDNWAILKDQAEAMYGALETPITEQVRKES